MTPVSFLNPSAAETRRARLLIGGGAVLATVVIGAAFFAGRDYPEPDPIVIYANSWGADRTRDDTLKDRAREATEMAAKLEKSRAYIATLPPEKRKLAQAEYDRYLAAPAKDRVN